MFLKRTNTGRVVYERARHFFSYKAIARILREQITGYESNDPENIVWVVLYAFQNQSARVFEKVAEISEVFEALAPPQVQTFVSAASMFGQSLVQLAQEWWGRHGPISWRQPGGVPTPPPPQKTQPRQSSRGFLSIPSQNPWDLAIRALHAELSFYLDAQDSSTAGGSWVEGYEGVTNGQE